MPTTSIYLPTDLYEFVKADPSKIVQAAVRTIMDKGNVSKDELSATQDN